MEKIRKLSIRKILFLYLLVSLICCFFLSAIIVGVATYTQKQIWLKYIDQESYYDAQSKEDANYTVTIVRPQNSEMKDIDRSISEACDFLETYGILVISVFGSGLAVLLFYRNKLKAPLDELGIASQRIAENDLDFRISYESQDEMGQLCADFERMRSQLMHNNQTLWRTIEEEKILRSAIAHDIRSPLSVLKGYQEMLMEYVPDGTISNEKTVEMLSESMKQINRMDLFIETMRKMNSLDARELKPTSLSLLELKADIQSEVDMLAGETGKVVILEVTQEDKTFNGDKEIILEVTENLITNSLRYAKEYIRIVMCIEQFHLKICVMDDGSGFTEHSDTVTKAFYQKNAKDSLEHAGLGMHISRVYCERHGGKLILENREQEGARVTAVFGRIV